MLDELSIAEIARQLRGYVSCGLTARFGLACWQNLSWLALPAPDDRRSQYDLLY